MSSPSHVAYTNQPPVMRKPDPPKNTFVACLESVLMIDHRPPQNPVSLWIWKKRIFWEAMLGIHMLNMWEKLLFMSIMCLFNVLVYHSVVNYLPSHMTLLRDRMAYYIYGDESVPLLWGSSSLSPSLEGAHRATTSLAHGMTSVTEAIRHTVTGKADL